MSSNLRFAVAGLVLVAACIRRTDAAFVHEGLADPATEGWSANGPGIGVTVGPVEDDRGTGINAWSTNDQTNADGSFLQYERAISSSTLANAAAEGWTLTARLRVVDRGDAADFSVYAQLLDSVKGYSMLFGSSVTGDPIVLLPTSTGNNPGGPRVELVGLGDGYHSYTLTHQPGSATTSLAVDGISVITGYSGYLDNTSALVGWGAGSSLYFGHGHFNRIDFVADVPEPTALSALSGMLVTVLRRRQR